MTLRSFWIDLRSNGNKTLLVLLKPLQNPSSVPTRSDTQILYSCPRHPNDKLEKKNTNTQYGYWKPYKCPLKHCFVGCGVNDIEYYLESAKCQLHNFYLTKPMHIMKCYCHRPLNHAHVPVREEFRETLV